jgi:hypothetical protein
MNELKTVLWGLDLDEGIRFEADYPGRENGAFVFVTKCDEKYCVSIKDRTYDAILRKYVPGGREEWMYFDTVDEMWSFVSKLLKEPLEAYYY